MKLRKLYDVLDDAQLSASIIIITLTIVRIIIGAILIKKEEML